MKTESKYLKQAMNEGYHLVTSTKDWSSKFTDDKKIILLNGILEFFQEEEEYEKCQTLKNLILKIKDVKE